MSPFTGLS